MAYLQASAFRKVLGDVWYRANKDRLGAEDPVCHLMEAIQWCPTSVLEIGCANGWRLKKLQEKYGCEVAGIEPSREAIKNAVIENIYQGTAEQKIFENDAYFDTIIYGFCFAFIDPPDYFRTLSEGDRLLKDGGMVFLHDRAMPVPVKRRIYGVTMLHKDSGNCVDHDIMMHHMDFPRLWLANPCYKEVNRLTNPDTLDFVCAIHKEIENAYLIGTPGTRKDGMQVTSDGMPIYPETENAA